MINTSSISVATTEDVYVLVNLVNSAYRGESAKKGWTHEASLLDGVRTDTSSLTELINQPNAAILKYTNHTGTIIGCVFIQKQETQLYLGMLTVLPDVQAQGIGKQLLKAAEDYALQQQCTSIVMTVISVRQELISWYERKGYKKTGETEPFPNDPRFGIPKQPLEFVVMEKILAR